MRKIAVESSSTINREPPDIIKNIGTFLDMHLFEHKLLPEGTALFVNKNQDGTIKDVIRVINIGE
jgi:hypothetical protein